MRRIFPFLLILLLLAPTAEAAQDNLLVNGDIDAVSGAGFPTGWYRDMWFTGAGVSSLSAEADGIEGNGLSVENAGLNDARWAQDVAVEPNALYRLSAMVRAEGVSEDGIGANLSVKGSFSYSNLAYDTGGDWVELSLVGRTGADQREITVFARLGGYGDENLAAGYAVFDNLSLVKLDAEPEGEVVHSFAASSGGGTAAQAIAEDEAPPRHTEALLLFLFVYALVVIGVARKKNAPGAKEKRWHLWALLAVALAARLLLAAKVRGYNTDIGCFEAWSQRMASIGPLNFYAPDYFCDYPPAYMLMLAPVEWLRMLLRFPVDSTGHLVLLKLLPVACDLLGAGILYRFAKKRLGARAALLLAGFYALNPAVIIDSAAWGQIDSVLTLMLVICALEVAEGRYLTALPAFAFAMLIKPQALLFAPLGLAAVVVGVLSSKQVWREALKALLGVLAALLLLFVAAIPFSLKSGLSPAAWLWNLYGGTFGGYRYLTVNTFNLYTIFGFNWAPMGSVGLWGMISWGLFVFSYIYAIGLLALSRDVKKIFLSGGVLIALITALGPMMHERYVFPALILLLLGYAECRDKRILYGSLVLTATLFMNQALVLQGGMTAANFGHLQASEAWLNVLFSAVAVLNALYLAYVAFDCTFRRTKLLASAPKLPAPKPEPGYKLNLKRIDVLLMAAVTLVYSLVAFTNLGATEAPQTSWVSSAEGETAAIDLGEERDFRMTYYGGISGIAFTVAFSSDGETWSEPTEALYNEGEIFRWLWLDSGGATQRARFVRLIADDAGVVLSEVGFLDAEGKPYPIASSTIGLLVDEQYTVPAHPSYLNSTYFDEIYHARTAYEHLHGLKTYEWTHPPLGKVLMMLGIEWFGMTPFGWRFMGALAGVLMLPLLYLIVKQLTKRSDLSTIAMFLFAVDSMHFTQTRIATIDSYAVLFILAMYFFMFRFSQMRWRRDGFARSLAALGLSGLLMGVAWATKWIGIYASVGLAVIFFWAVFANLREMDWQPHFKVGALGLLTTWAGLILALISLASAVLDHAGILAQGTSSLFFLLSALSRWWIPALALGAALCLAGVAILMAYDRGRDWLRLSVLSIFAVAMFILVPLLIYYFSYYWQMQYEGGLSIERVVNLQKGIFNYHAGLGGDTHPFRSEWYEWPVIAWPMWFYAGTAYMPEGVISSISCMGNPAVWWFGLGALLFVAVKTAWSRRAPKVYLLVLIAFASQYLPWVLVPRSTFIYHYFASVPFIIVASVLLLAELRNRRRFRIAAGVLMAAALILFIAFYPLESGMPVARSYANLLRWFNWHNF